MRHQTRARTCSVAAPTEDRPSVLMEGIENVGRELHPRTLRFGSRPIAVINPDGHHGPRRYRYGSDPQRVSESSPPPTGHQPYHVNIVPDSRSARESNRADVALAERLTPLDHGRSVGWGLPARTPIAGAADAVRP